MPGFALSDESFLPSDAMMRDTTAQSAAVSTLFCRHAGRFALPGVENLLNAQIPGR